MKITFSKDKHLNPHDLQLHHLHLQGLLLSLGVVGLLVGGAKRSDIWIHSALLLRKPVVGPINSSGHGHVPVSTVLIDVGHF